jgi:hypothetical protein
MQANTPANIWMRTHNYLSMFFLPVALLYAVTGGLYIMGVKGGTDRQVIEVATEQPLPQDAGTLQAFVEAHLQGRGLRLPEGNAQFARGRFLWGQPSGYHVMLEPLEGSTGTRILCNTPGLHSRMVMLHKAKCGTPFKVLSIAFAAAMTLIYLSGIVIGWRAVSLRKTFMAALAGGTLVTLILVWLSL